MFRQMMGLLPLVLSASFLMSCGAAKTGAGYSDQSSRTLSSTKPLAYCNQTTDAAHSLTANIGAFLNTSGGVDLNYLHIKLTNVPDTFTDNSHYFSFFKWYVDAGGNPITYNQPLSFKLVNIQTGQDMSGNLTRLKWNTVATLATGLNVTTPAQFFKKVRIFVFIDDPTGAYDAVTIGYHLESSGVADNRIDALMPVFEADPRDYAVSHAKLLSSLHPFAAADYSTWTASIFTAKANDFCTALSQY